MMDNVEKLKKHCEETDQYWMIRDEILEFVSVEEWDQISKKMGAITVTRDEKGNTMIPVTDILYGITGLIRYFD